MIVPTVGRIVWYWPPRDHSLVCNPDEPLAAIVASVVDVPYQKSVAKGDVEPTHHAPAKSKGRHR